MDDKFKDFFEAGKTSRGPNYNPSRELFDKYWPMSYDKLEKLKVKYKEWLKVNRSHPKYPDGLRNYEMVCDVISHKIAEDIPF